MKAIAIALGVICAILVFALLRSGASAKAELQAAQTNQVSLSNEVAEVRTRLVLANVTSTQTISNLQHGLNKRTSDLNILSNRLVQTHLLLQSAQKEGHSVQDQLQARIARVAVLEAEVDQFRLRASRSMESDSVNREKQALNQLADVTMERDALRTQLGAALVENRALQVQLLDPEFLERQMKDAETAADIRRRMAGARAGAAPDPRLKLELQPNGTVRYVDPRPTP